MAFDAFPFPDLLERYFPKPPAAEDDEEDDDEDDEPDFFPQEIPW